MGELGVPELLVIFGIALLIFGPKKLGDLGKSLGDGIRHFKGALKGDEPAPPPETVSTEPPKK